MKSINLYTPESDILEDGIAELKEQMEGFELLKNTVGLLFISPDSDQEELVALLGDMFDFPIIGCTSMAMLTKDGRCQNAGLNMMVLTADDCQFHIIEIEDMLSADYKEQLAKKYEAMIKSLPDGEMPRLIISYSASIHDGAGDDVIRELDSISGGVPVYGGLCSDSFRFEQYGVFTQAGLYKTGLVMMAVTGNIRPLFACEYSISKEGNFSAVVTKSYRNKVFELNNQKFIDVLEENGMFSENVDVGLEFVCNPFLSAVEQEDGTRVRVTRMLTKLDHEQGSGEFLGGIPEGAVLGSAIVNKEDLTVSVESCFKEIFDRIREENGYEYTTILVTSCGGRYLWLTTDRDAEAKAYADKIPEGLSLCGMYSFGEFAPVEKENKLYNMFHNGTFTILVI